MVYVYILVRRRLVSCTTPFVSRAYVSLSFVPQCCAVPSVIFWPGVKGFYDPRNTIIYVGYWWISLVNHYRSGLANTGINAARAFVPVAYKVSWRSSVTHVDFLQGSLHELPRVLATDLILQKVKKKHINQQIFSAKKCRHALTPLLPHLPFPPSLPPLSCVL